MARRLPNRAERLLEDARRNTEYRLFTIQGDGTPKSYSVSASVLSRYDAETPINDNEGVAFAFLRVNPDIIEEAAKLIDQRRRRGATRWSPNHLVAVLRWEHEKAIMRVDDEFKVDDHISPTLGRIFNEVLGEPFFELRRASGEPD